MNKCCVLWTSTEKDDFLDCRFRKEKFSFVIPLGKIKYCPECGKGLLTDSIWRRVAKEHFRGKK